jgi:N-formylglutamate deformylase
MNPVEVTQGTSPVILGMPHVGTHVPDDILACLNEEGRKLRDTDWHVDRLYDGLLPHATIVRATFHRYVIDANRDPSGDSLYPGQTTTGLVPLFDFDNQPIWTEGSAPDEAETARRIEAFHRPYHAVLEAEIERVKAEHGIVVLYDCHSIRSRCPFLFEGQLPDLNIGTDNGRTSAVPLQAAVEMLAEMAEGYSHVVNGRFRGGWTTRHYGRPEEGIHAIQMEIAQSAYLETEAPPFAYDEDKAAALRLHLRAILERIETIALGMAAATGDRK